MIKPGSKKEFFSRREFLGKSAIGAAGVMSAGLLSGCAPAAVTNEGAEEAPTADTTANFLVPPPPIEASEIIETVEADVVIAGSGTAGTLAALGAADGGAKVVVLEKWEYSRTGGADYGAIGSSLQKELGIDKILDPQRAMLLFNQHTNFYVNPHMLSDWIYNSGTILDRMLEVLKPKGITAEIRPWPAPADWDYQDEACECWPTPHSVGPTGKGEDDNVYVLDALQEYLKEQGVEFKFLTPAIQLEKDDTGRISGVIAKNQSGEYIRFNAKMGVVLATGDFGGNPEMMNYYFSPDYAEIAATRNTWTAYMKNPPSETLNTGDGHKMALWVGAQMEDVARSFAGDSWTAIENMYMQVNNLGERFHNEDTDYSLWTRDIMRQPDRTAWTILDSNWEQYKDLASWGLWGPPKFDASNPTYTADTIEELAQQIGIPLKNLIATVEKRNAMHEKGLDPEYGQKGTRVTPIREPPFMAFMVPANFCVTLSGVRVTWNSQVIDKGCNPIPGLYAAGNVVGERFTNTYYPFFGGTMNGFGMSTGYLAGKHAAAQ
jgi:fumarate reductase flavoprotein subunit